MVSAPASWGSGPPAVWQEQVRSFAGTADAGAGGHPGRLSVLGNLAMGPALFILGAASFYPLSGGHGLGLREGRAASAGGDESGAAAGGYTIGSLLGPAYTALLMQHYRITCCLSHRQRVLHLSADAVAAPLR